MLVIPAAGAGSRLGSSLPKLLVPVLGRAMIDWLVALYAPFVSRLVLVVSPNARESVEDRDWATDLPRQIVVQDRPTGMLDAILLAAGALRNTSATRVWTTWCDQIAMSATTVTRLAQADAAHPDAAIVMPTAVRPDPYIHFDRDAESRITAVRQRREGDPMPAVGESDAGLFSFSRSAFLSLLPQYGSATPAGAATGERNVLPFIPWAAARGPVITFPCAHDMEAVGINTPEELTRVEAFLAAGNRR